VEHDPFLVLFFHDTLCALHNFSPLLPIPIADPYLLFAFVMFHEWSVVAGEALQYTQYTDFENQAFSALTLLPGNPSFWSAGWAAVVRWTDSKGTLVRKVAISGDVDLRRGSDWYESSASLHCQPGDVSSGQLEFHYRFKDH